HAMQPSKPITQTSDFPHACRAIEASGDDECAIGAEGDAREPSGVPTKNDEVASVRTQRTHRRDPDASAAVAAAGRDHAAVETKEGLLQRILKAPNLCDALPGADLAQADGLVSTRGDDVLPVRAERRTIHPRRVTVQLDDGTSAGHVPDPHRGFTACG